MRCPYFFFGSQVLSVALILTGCGGSNPAAPPGNGGGSGSTSSTNPAPTLSALSPSTAPALSPGLKLQVTGTGFVTSSTVNWNGVALQSTYGSGTSLSAVVPASDLASEGTAMVTIVSPAPGGGTSSALTFTITAPLNPAPTLSSISPNSATVGSGAITITATGAGFVSSSVVQWNGANLQTGFGSSTSLTASVPASDLAAATTASVTILTPSPGGGTSSPLTFTVKAPTIPAVYAVSVTANQVAYSAASGMLYLSIPSTAANGNSIVPIDPLTANFGASSFAGSEPDLLSVSETGAYLYVGLDGSSSVERMTLPGLQQDITVSLGADSSFGPYYPMDLQASPVSDHTFAVVRANSGVSPAEEGGVFIYDDSTPRANPLCGFSGFIKNCVGSIGGLWNSIQWNEHGTVMYGDNNEDTGFDFYTVSVSANGFSNVKDCGGDFSGFNNAQIHYDATTKLVYGNDGTVIDPATGAQAGVFQASGFMVPDGANGLVYFLGTDGQHPSTLMIESFDINRYTPVNIMTIPNVIGTPGRLIRWGAHGLAFLTNSSQQAGNELFLINDPSFVGNKTTNPAATNNMVRQIVTRPTPHEPAIH